MNANDRGSLSGAGAGVFATQVLVVVHPGSACGSADFNLGKVEARTAREGLVQDLDEWMGGIVVLDGELSDELVRYASLQGALERALARSAASGHTSLRLAADDPHQVNVVRDIAERLNWSANSIRCTITGAWYMPSGGGGCVGSVHETLQSIGVVAHVSANAVHLDVDALDVETEVGM